MNTNSQLLLRLLQYNAMFWRTPPRTQAFFYQPNPTHLPHVFFLKQLKQYKPQRRNLINDTSKWLGLSLFLCRFLLCMHRAGMTNAPTRPHWIIRQTNWNEEQNCGLDTFVNHVRNATMCTNGAPLTTGQTVQRLCFALLALSLRPTQYLKINPYLSSSPFTREHFMKEDKVKGQIYLFNILYELSHLVSVFFYYLKFISDCLNFKYNVADWTFHLDNSALHSEIT